MVKIFANLNTDEKVLVLCAKSQVDEVRNLIQLKYGGAWLYVDDIDPRTEILKFNDGMIYSGFNPEQERYANGIEKLIS